MARWTVHAIVAVVAGAAVAQEPEARLSVEAPETARAGKPVHIVYDIAWQGAPQTLDVLPLEYKEEVEWGAVVLLKSESYRTGNLNHVAQTVAITPAQPGEYHVPQVSIPLRYPEATFPTEQGTDESGSPHPGAYPTLRADPLPISVRAARSPAWISGGLGASLFLLGLMYYLVQRRRQAAPAAPFLTPEERFSQARQSMHRARRHRLDGDFHAYYTELSRTASLMNAESLKARLDRAADKVGYAKARPTEDDLEGAWREIERAAAVCSKGLQE